MNKGKKRLNISSRKKNFKKKGFFRENYSLGWSYIKESRNYIFFILLVFFIGALVGLFWHPDFVVEIVVEFMKRVTEETSGLGMGELILYILNNNLQASFMGMVFGFFVGITSTAITLINGYVLGFISGVAVEAGGISILWRLVPHGIFEIPALILSLALGVRLGFSWFRVRDKAKGVLALVVSFLAFTALYVVLTGFFVGFFMIADSGSVEDVYSSGFSGGPVFLLLFLVILFASVFIGTFFLAKGDRGRFFKEIEGALRVFLFIIIPLLIIAAIIEGMLIAFLA